MSRSRKRTPISGNTMARSEKDDKRRYNRAYRRATKQFLRHFDPELDLFPHLREHSDPWVMEKDGKHWFNPAQHPEMMRK